MSRMVCLVWADLALGGYGTGCMLAYLTLQVLRPLLALRADPFVGRITVSRSPHIHIVISLWKTLLSLSGFRYVCIAHACHYWSV